MLRRVHRLLHIGSRQGWLYSHGVARPLVEFVQQTLLVDGGWGGRRHEFWSHGYMKGLQLLAVAAMCVERHSPSRSEEDRVKLLRELVNNDCRVGLRLVVVTG